MDTNNITIRLENKEDYREVENLVRDIVTCHEFDHLEGILYIDKAENIRSAEEEEEEE